MPLRQAVRTVPVHGLLLTIGLGKYLAAVFVGLGVVLAGYVQTFFGYTVGHLCILLGLLVLWSEGRTLGSPSLNGVPPPPIERRRWADSLQAVGDAASVLIYIGAAITWLVRANLALDTRQLRHTLRRGPASRR